jgi:hypothetical protein
MEERHPSYYRARIDFDFGGVKVRTGEIVPCHRPPWSCLLSQGQRFVEAIYTDDVSSACHPA